MGLAVVARIYPYDHARAPSPLFAAISEINARDKYNVEFKLATPRSVNFMMSAFASGWNVIFSKKTLEENDYNLRKVSNIPGTGPGPPGTQHSNRPASI